MQSQKMSWNETRPLSAKLHGSFSQHQKGWRILHIKFLTSCGESYKKEYITFHGRLGSCKTLQCGRNLYWGNKVENRTERVLKSYPGAFLIYCLVQPPFAPGVVFCLLPIVPFHIVQRIVGYIQSTLMCMVYCCIMSTTLPLSRIGRVHIMKWATIK